MGNYIIVFVNEQTAIDTEAYISVSMGLPSALGERWDIPEQREVDGELKWSIFKPANEYLPDPLNGEVVELIPEL